MYRLPRSLGSTLLAGALLAGGTANAADDPQVRAWAATCAACHGTDGHSVGGMPPIAGEPHDRLYQRLLAFKNGTRPATVMHQHAKGYTDEELERLATYFSSQRP